MSGLNGTTVLVTGAGGFLGSHVVRRLARHGAYIRAHLGPLGHDSSNARDAAASFAADICDEAAFHDQMKGIQLVVHLAGPPSVAQSFAQPAEYVRAHVEGTAVVMSAARLAGVKRIIYVSSAEVYGRPLRNPVEESHRLEARSPYAAAKIAAEHLLQSSWHAFGLSATILRPFCIYGPGASPGSLVATILRLAECGGVVELADLRPIRDYCFVDDFSDAVFRCSLRAEPGFEVLNIGTGRATSVLELAYCVLKALGRESVPVRETGATRPGSSDIYELVADTERAASLLGWRSLNSLDQGLRKTVACLSPCAI